MSMLNIDRLQVPRELRNGRTISSGSYSVSSSAGNSGSGNYAAKSTTLAGYGITDAYTKDEANATYAKLAHTHTIADLTDKPYDIVGNTVVFKYAVSSVANITAYSATGNNATIFDALSGHVDNQTIGYSGGLLYLKNGSTFSGSWNNLTDKPTTVAGYGISDAFTKTETEARYKSINWAPDLSAYQLASTAITTSNIAAQSVNYAATAGSAPASDVCAWAKAATKPAYSYGEISGTPDLSVYQPAATAWNAGNFNPATKADLNGSGSVNFNANTFAGNLFSTSVSGKANYIGNWSGAGYWGIGSLSGHIVKIDQVASLTDGTWQDAGDVNLYLGTNPVYHTGNLNNPISTGCYIGLDNGLLADNQRNNSIFAYSNSGAPYSGTLLTVGGFNTGLYPLQIQGSYTNNLLAFRNKSDDGGGTWGAWREIYHTGNFNPATKADLNGSYSSYFSANNIFLQAGNENGLRFWNGSDAYSIYMASSSYGGNLMSDSANDYNIYYKCYNGNRGHAFITGNGSITTQINNDGIYTKGWFRNVEVGAGWYNQSTGAGLSSTSSLLIETYNNSALKVNGLLTAAAGLKVGDITIQSDGANGVEFRNSSNVLLMVLNANGEIKTKGNHYFNQAL